MIRSIDLETTGLDPEQDAIIEIASVDLTREHGIANFQESLVNPLVPIPHAASAVNHLIEPDVRNAPCLADVLPRFAGADWYVAHQCDFERGFLEPHWPATRWLCTMKCALRIWPDLASHSNQFLRYYLGLVAPFGLERSQIVPHRALGDAIVTAAIFCEMLKVARWSELVAWSAEPALYTVLSFGKYKGQRYDAVDPDYLSWLAIAQHDLSPDVRFSAHHWLEQRRGGARHGKVQKQAD